VVGDLREGVQQANDKNALQTVADGCVACKLFFSKSMGIRVNSHANFFLGWRRADQIYAPVQI